MGGQIGMESEPGNGSRFWFTLPFRRLRPEETNTDLKMLRGQRALVVDDNRTNRETLCSYLGGWGIDVKEVACGSDAIVAVENARTSAEDFDLILLDMDMPGLSGIDVARLIGEMPGIANEKIVLLSSINADESIHEENIGMSATLTKPIRAGVLRSCLLNIICRDKTLRMVERTIGKLNQAGENPLGHHILLVEDNPVNQKVAVSSLARLGCSYETADDGVEGVDKIKRGKFNAILMDCQMPEMDGFEATRAIRAWEAETGRTPIPIIALTANAIHGDKEKCLAAGMDDYISKPFTVAELREHLKRLLHGNREKVALETGEYLGMPPQAENGDDDVVTGKYSIGDDRPALDQTALDDLRMMEPDGGQFFQNIIEAYFESAPNLIDELRIGLEKDDADSVGRVAHSLKSSSGNVGASSLSRLCQEIEERARTKNLKDSRELKQQVEREFVRVLHALREEVEQTVS
jgi:CheY-like chemotaxis protein/HPt (histidine-containing phosphotransfer) domain-containing protein